MDFGDKSAKMLDCQTMPVWAATLNYWRCFLEEREMKRDSESIGEYLPGGSGGIAPGRIWEALFFKNCKTDEFSDNAGVGSHLKLLEMLFSEESDGER